MKKFITIILIIILSLISISCVVNKEFNEGYNGVIYQKNHDYYYMSNDDFIKYKYCYHLDL
jgi:uncharacterized protein YxeA